MAIRPTSPEALITVPGFITIDERRGWLSLVLYVYIFDEIDPHHSVQLYRDP